MTIKYRRLLALLLILLVSVIFLYLSVGASDISLSSIVASLFRDMGPEARIFFYLRVPRCIACILVGAALSCSGLLLQAVLNNSLASPGIIGINSGAGFAVVLAAVFFSGSVLARTLSAFAGAFCTAFLVYGIAHVTGAARSTIVLSGVAISSLFSALIDTISTLFPTTITDRAAFSLGSFQAVSIDSLLLSGPLIILAFMTALLLAGHLDLLILGDEVAASLGIHVTRSRFLVLFSASLLAAGAVSISGLLGFLGLIVPHIVRTVLGTSSHRKLLLLSALAGACLTLLCDLLARMLFLPYELPVGIPLSILGVPFFLYLLLGKGRRYRYDTN